MEPLNEKELDQILRAWEAPLAPPSLTRRVLQPRKSPWRWLLTGTIRVPVPVGVVAILLIALWLYFSKPSSPIPAAEGSRSVSLVDFQPAPQLTPVSLGGERK